MKFLSSLRAMRRNSCNSSSINNNITKEALYSSHHSFETMEESESVASCGVPRTVVFSTSNDQVHECSWVIVSDSQTRSIGDNHDTDDDDVVDDVTSTTLADNEILQSRCWYSKTEIYHFKQDVRIMSKYNLSYEQRMWTQSLWHVYQHFCKANSVEEMQAIMDKAMPVDATLLGMEKWALPTIQTGRARQRSQQLQAIQEVYCSRSKKCSPLERDQRIRKLCREASRTSRFMAIYLARTTQA